MVVTIEHIVNRTCGQALSKLLASSIISYGRRDHRINISGPCAGVDLKISKKTKYLEDIDYEEMAED